MKVGQQAPVFTLPNQDNRNVSLSDFLGYWVVIYFYPKDNTPGCTTEACGFRDADNELEKANIKVVGMSQDLVASHKKFAEKFHLNFDILSDPDRRVINAYGAWQQKSMFGKKYFGIKRMTFLIDPKGKINHVWPRVTPQNHAEEILDQVHRGAT